MLLSVHLEFMRVRNTVEIKRLPDDVANFFNEILPATLGWLQIALRCKAVL